MKRYLVTACYYAEAEIEAESEVQAEREAYFGTQVFHEPECITVEELPDYDDYDDEGVEEDEEG